MVQYVGNHMQCHLHGLPLICHTTGTAISLDSAYLHIHLFVSLLIFYWLIHSAILLNFMKILRFISCQKKSQFRLSFCVTVLLVLCVLGLIQYNYMQRFSFRRSFKKQKTHNPSYTTLYVVSFCFFIVVLQYLLLFLMVWLMLPNGS